MNRLNSLCLLFTVILLTGCDELPLQALGQLESHRIELVAEVFESILSITVLEGDRLAAGRLILQQDTSRVEIRIAEARANIARIEALLAEQVSGPRTETIDTVKASLDEAEIDRVFRQRDLNRLLGLREQNLTSIESMDTAEKYVELARARIEIVQAQLAELEAGTREEQIAQTNGLLEQARAQLASLDLDRQRHSITAPVDALLDSLPFEIGERPRPGDVIAVLLSGDQPYARLYIPESVRIQIGQVLPCRFMSMVSMARLPVPCGAFLLSLVLHRTSPSPREIAGACPMLPKSHCLPCRIDCRTACRFKSTSNRRRRI